MEGLLKICSEFGSRRGFINGENIARREFLECDLEPNTYANSCKGQA